MCRSPSCQFCLGVPSKVTVTTLIHILFIKSEEMLYYIFHNVLMEIFKSIHYCTSLQQLLNHCFDDVEKFVARLQQAAEAYKELEKRKRDRNSKNKKKQNGGN